MTCYTTSQLASAAGLTMRTIHAHISQGWLKPMGKDELPKGVRGHRFSLPIAKKWISTRYPDKRLPQ